MCVYRYVHASIFSTNTLKMLFMSTLKYCTNDTNPENSNSLDFQKWFICRIEDTFHVLQLHPNEQLFLSLPPRSSESKNSMYLGYFSSAVFIDHGVQELLRRLQDIFLLLSFLYSENEFREKKQVA